MSEDSEPTLSLSAEETRQHTVARTCRGYRRDRCRAHPVPAAAPASGRLSAGVSAVVRCRRPDPASLA